LKPKKFEGKKKLTKRQEKNLAKSMSTNRRIPDAVGSDAEEEEEEEKKEEESSEEEQDEETEERIPKKKKQ
jgi:hypothetical protein